jgi:UDP-GlcNAc:undecaprenyl-phosphate GlcNAc-1-phosphate transferase
MDGLSAGVAGIAAASFFVIAAANGQFLIAALSLALSGCALGFLRHNFHPARIYMGDAGSLFLGFVLAAIGIKLRFEAPVEVTAFVPFIVLGIAVLDTTLVTTTRLLHGRNPLSGGRDHISHRLVFIGIPVPAAVGLIYAAAIGHGWMALVMSRLDVVTGLLLMGLVLATDVFLGVLLAHVPVYETNTQRRMALVEVTRHPQQTPAAAAEREPSQ